MNDENEFSLWLVPGQASASMLFALIESLADRFGGPVFAPHLTLLSSVRSEALGLAAAEALQRDTGKIRQFPGSVEGTAAFFRNLYVRMATDRLLPLHLRCALAAEGPVDTAFLPHISLFYGHLTSRERELAMGDITSQLPVEVEFDAVELWSVRGAVQAWRRQARVALG